MRCDSHIHVNAGGNESPVPCDLEVHDETVDHAGWVRVNWQADHHTHDEPAPAMATGGVVRPTGEPIFPNENGVSETILRGS